MLGLQLRMILCVEKQRENSSSSLSESQRLKAGLFVCNDSIDQMRETISLLVNQNHFSAPHEHAAKTVLFPICPVSHLINDIN